MDIVVGSGPSGISVARALLDRGRKVTMIDGGALPDPGTATRQSAMAATPPEQWDASQIANWQSPQFSAPPGTARRYGSDHVQLPAGETFAPDTDWFGLRASHAVGGLSNLWGAAVLPNRQADMADWPITADDLAPHYRAVADFMPISGRADALEKLFPALPMAGRTPLNSGPQGKVLLARLNGISARLSDQGVQFGQARQAVAPGCKYCGMCLHGCPWNMIFAAGQALDLLKGYGSFTYLPGRVLARISESPKSVQLQLMGGTTLKGARLFLGAGVLETARIVLASRPGQNQTLMLRDSQHFFLPLLHSWRASGHVENTPHHTLTEAFIEIDDPAISPFLTHTQIYGWNEFYARDMITRYGRLLPGSAPLFRLLARRLMVAQTFLHSDHSHRIELALAPGDQRLAATLHENPATAGILSAAKVKIAKVMSQAGLHALKFAASAGAPGSSFHSGSTLPMSSTQTGLSTDPTGKLNGLSRVHVVDASVLPAITATTITFTVMANAHRIGTVA